MIVTFTITTATLVIGSLVVGANAGMAWISRKYAQKRLKAQHDYEEKVMQEGHKAAMQQFKELCDVKKEIAEEEFNKNLEFLNQQQKQSIHDAAYFSSLDEWPLYVPPMVMRNDNLFVPNDKDVSTNLVMQVEPVHIIFAPCSDVMFRNNFHAEIEKKLSSYFEQFWGPSTLHPVIFYQQAWKNKTKDADQITVKNIYSKISTIPTIIINPVVGKNSLRFEVSFWNILEDNREGNKEGMVFSLPIEFPCNGFFFKANSDYPEEIKVIVVQETVSFLKSMLSMLIDQYSWRRYHFPPNQTRVINEKGLSYNNAEIESLAEDYNQTLQRSIDNAEIFIITEPNNVLNYCKNVDSLNNDKKCLETILRKLLKQDSSSFEDLLLSIPFYGCEFEKQLLVFCENNASLYQISEDTINKLRYKYTYDYLMEVIEKKLSQTINHRPYNAGQGKDTVAYKSVIEQINSHYNSFWKRCNLLTMSIINQSRDFHDLTDKRNWARPKINKMVSDEYLKEEKAIMKDIHPKIAFIKEESIVSFLQSVVKENVDKLNFDKKILDSVYSELNHFLKEKYISNDVEWSPLPYMVMGKEHKDYANMVVKTWIQYEFMEEDIVKFPNMIPKGQLEDIKNCFYNKIWKNIEKDFEQGLETILNKSYGINANSSDYDSSLELYDNTVAEVLLDSCMS